MALPSELLHIHQFPKCFFGFLSFSLQLRVILPRIFVRFQEDTNVHGGVYAVSFPRRPSLCSVLPLVIQLLSSWLQQGCSCSGHQIHIPGRKKKDLCQLRPSRFFEKASQETFSYIRWPLLAARESGNIYFSVVTFPLQTRHILFNVENGGFHILLRLRAHSRVNH